MHPASLLLKLGCGNFPPATPVGKWKGGFISGLEPALEGSGIKGVKAGPGSGAAIPYIVSKVFHAAWPFL